MNVAVVVVLFDHFAVVSYRTPQTRGFFASLVQSYCWTRAHLLLLLLLVCRCNQTAALSFWWVFFCPKQVGRKMRMSRKLNNVPDNLLGHSPTFMIQSLSTVGTVSDRHDHPSHLYTLRSNRIYKNRHTQEKISQATAAFRSCTVSERESNSRTLGTMPRCFWFRACDSSSVREVLSHTKDESSISTLT